MPWEPSPRSRPQALQIEVQVAHRKVSGSAPVVQGDVWGRKAVRMAATSFGLADLVVPGKRPGHVLPLAGYTAVRRPRQRPRVEQFGKWETARNAMRRSDADCACGRFLCGSGREATAPGTASAIRAGVSRLVLLGDPPSLDEDDPDPHCCVKPCDAVAVPSLAATRGASFPTLAAGLLFGDDGVVVAVFSSPHDRDASLVPATASPAATVQASIQDLALSRRAPRVVRRSREAAALPCSMPMPPVLTGRPHGASRRFAPAAFQLRGASVPNAGASPRRLQNALASRKRHLGVGNQAMVTAPLPDSRRLSGFPVWSEWLPTGHHRATPEHLQCTAGTKAAPAPRA